jgi:hypothetical protein
MENILDQINDEQKNDYLTRFNAFEFSRIMVRNRIELDIILVDLKIIWSR